MTVAETSERLGGGVLVTTNRPHHLVQNDALVGNSGEIFAHVKEVVTPTQIVIDIQEGRPKAGQPVSVERGPRQLPSLEQEITRLADEEEDVEAKTFLTALSRDNCQSRCLLGANLGPSELLSLAGLLAGSLLSLLNQRKFSSELRLIPSPKTPSLSKSTSLLVSSSSTSPLSSTVVALLKEMELLVKVVGPEAGEEEKSALFSETSAVISAGGSFDNRRAVEALCVEHSLPLLDLSVEGTAGQAELFLPHKTVSYSHVGEPQESTPPHCVLKSFPHLPEHCAIWAKEKAASLDHERASITIIFCLAMAGNRNKSDTNGRCEDLNLPKGAAVAHKYLTLLGLNPTWFSCVRAARLKWEKYFSNKVGCLQHDVILTLLQPGVPVIVNIPPGHRHQRQLAFLVLAKGGSEPVEI